MQLFFRQYSSALGVLNQLSPYFSLLALRLLLGWEFGEAGYEKLHGSNWFSEITFPFPFNLLPATASWEIAKWFEICGAAALILGLATRFFSLSLFILTIVAIASVHWPEHWNNLGELLQGYRFIDEAGDGYGNYKLPFMYLAMLVPLIFSGSGKLSVDQIFFKIYK